MLYITSDIDADVLIASGRARCLFSVSSIFSVSVLAFKSDEIDDNPSSPNVGYKNENFVHFYCLKINFCIFFPHKFASSQQHSSNIT